MGQQTLRTVISIGGNVDNTFGQIGTALIGLGSQIDMVSQKIIDFGKESVTEYVNYDDLMREVKAVGEFTDAEISALDEINRQIAQTTIYSNKQAAEAEVFMGQLGLNTQEIAALLPDVLDLAMAGNLDLADSVNYLYSVIKSLDLELSDSSTLTDQMAKTAAIGATDIDTLGDALTRIGSGLQLFAGGAPEVLTILSTMSDFGEDMRGSEGGTALRNFALSLIAPAGATREVLAALENLGMSEDDLSAYLEDEGIELTNAAAALDALGINVFDENGNLRSMLDIISDLRTATQGLDKDLRTQTLRQIFGKRGYVTAENLLSITDEEYQLEYAEIVDSEGFADEMAETMQGGLGGALRELEAAYTEFKTTIGEVLAPAVENVADWLHEIVVDLSSMDKDTLEALVSGIGTIAAAGPALLTAGLAFRLIGYALTPAGGIGLGLIALVAAAEALEKLKEADMADNFGDMELDTESLSAYVQSLGEDFKASYAEVNEFSAALDAAVQSYTDASSTFSSDLLTATLTGNELTENEKTSLQNLGNEMYTQVITGISNSTAATMSYWQLLFGGEGTAENDPDYQSIINLTNQSYLDLMATAEGLSWKLRDALNAAFEDGTLTTEEYSNIMGVVDAYNQALAEAADKQNYIELQQLMHKAQTASYDEIKEFAQQIEEERTATLAEEEERFQSEYYGLEWDYDKAIEEGWEIDGKKVTEEDKQAALAAAQEYHDQRVQAQSAQYDDVLLNLWESSIGQSDLADAYSTLEDYAERYLAGEITGESASGIIGDLYGRSMYAGDTVFMWENPVRQQLGEYMARIISSLGGYEGAQEKMDYYTSIGDTDRANQIARLLAMEGIATDYAWMSVASDTAWGWWGGKVFGLEGGRDIEGENGFEGSLENYMNEYSAEAAKRTIAAFSGENGTLDQMFSAIGQSMAEENIGAIIAQEGELGKTGSREFDNIIESLAAIYDFEAVLANETSVLADEGSAYRDYVAAYSLLYGNASQNPEQYKYGATLEVEPSDPEADAKEYGDAFSENANATVNVAPEGEAAAQIEAEVTAQDPVADALAYSQEFSANANPYADVTPSSGTTAGNEWESAFEASANPYITVRYGGGGVNKMTAYAEGGRADEASVFGEAGPEWAIPEEHSERTASLLDAARAASGFTWPELIDRYGGLNADASSTPAQIIFAPTIHANDANGVEEKLVESEERFRQWYEDYRQREAAEVYS